MPFNMGMREFLTRKIHHYTMEMGSTTSDFHDYAIIQLFVVCSSEFLMCDLGKVHICPTDNADMLCT